MRGIAEEESSRVISNPPIEASSLTCCVYSIGLVCFESICLPACNGKVVFLLGVTLINFCSNGF